MKTALLSLLAAPSIWGCDLCAIYNSSAARGESSTGFHAAIAEQFTRSGTLQERGQKIDDPNRQFRNSSVTSAILGYNFNATVGISVNIPYVYRNFRRAEGFEVEEGSESGLGDVALIGRVFVLSKLEHEYSIGINLLGGLEFPTGDSDRLREETEEAEVPGAPPGGVHGDDLALGSGSFDGIVGAAGHLRWKRFLYTAEIQYFLRTRGDFDYRFGNEVSFFSGPGAYLIFEEEMTLAVQAGFTYESKARDNVRGQKRDEGIAVAWYASPGLAFTWGEHLSATLNGDIPIRIGNRSFQTVPDYRLRFGIGYSF